jgi:uroporphyrinogen III methyltransferase/synthase
MTHDRPLEGKTVVVTRPRAQAASLVDPLEHLGAEVLLAPTIRIVPRTLDDKIVRVVVNDLPDYRLIIFTSANGVDVFLDYLTELGLPFAALDDALVAAVGPKTASALEERGVTCDVVADDYVAEGLLATLAKHAVAPAGTRVLIPAARQARAMLADALRASGAVVDVLPVYDTLPVERLQVAAARIERAAFITFTSSSTARQFVRLMEAATERRGPGAAGRSLAERLSGAALCSIGPVTSDTLRELGLPVAVEASEHTAAGLVAAIAACASGLA